MKTNLTFLRLSCSKWCLCLALFGTLARAEVQPIPAPADEPLSPDFKVEAGGKDVAVYPAKVSGLTADERVPFDLVHFTSVVRTSFASFDLRGPTKVVVTCPTDVSSAKILPSSRGIALKVSGKTVIFSVSQPGPLVLEINGEKVRSLQIFVNPWETNVPNPKDPNVIYFGPGRHEIDPMSVPSGKTVYIAPGAVVYGKPTTEPTSIFALTGDHITLRGRGIIDGSLGLAQKQSSITAQGTDIHIEGVVLRDAAHWTLPMFNSSNVTVDNVKILGYRANTDGIDICNSQHVTVTNCYLRTFDDEIVLKSQKKDGLDLDDIQVSHCVIQNEFAHALSLGAELRANAENVTFSDCDIVHDRGREWVLRIYNCNEAHVHNVTFKDIRIEEARQLISVWIGQAVWSASPECGHIDGVLFQNIVSPTPSVAGTPWVDLVGLSADNAVHNVKLDHVRVNGHFLQPTNVAKTAFVSGIVIQPAF